MKKDATPESLETPPSTLQRNLARAGWAAGLVGLVSWIIRYALQGTSQVWTDTARALYVKDPTLGWAPTNEVWIWLGLEWFGAIIGVLVGSAALWWLAKRGLRGAPVMRFLAVAGALALFAAPALPLMAFFGGMPPEGAVAVLPQAPTAAAVIDSANAPVTLPLVGRQWVPSDEPTHTLIVAQLTAGGETFDAKFSPLRGHIALDPATPHTAKIEFGTDPASVTTGIPLRDSHAREYLDVGTHKEIKVTSVTLSTLTTTAEPDTFAWTADVTVALMGKTIAVPAEGKLRILGEEARRDLGVGDREAILLESAIVIPIAETPIDPELFDTKNISLSFRAVFLASSKEKSKD